MSQLMTMVEAAKNGSMHAEVGSGIKRHVGFVDRPPAGDRRAVEHQPVGQGVLVDQPLIEGHVLPFAARIGKAQIDIFDVVVLDRLQDILGGLHDLPFLKIKVRTFPPAAGSGGSPFDEPPKWR